MKKLLPIILLSALTGCSAVSTREEGGDYSRTAYEPRYAEGFRLMSLPTDTNALMLEVYRPDTLRLEIPKGGFRRLVCMSSTYVGSLSELGQAAKVVGVSGRDWLTNRKVAERAVEVGYDGAMDYETLLSAQPDLVLLYGIGGESPIAAKLDALGVKHVYINEFEEQKPLGRAEWAVALGALTDTDGRKAFAEVCRGYRPAEGETPVMLNAPYSGNWFIPGKENYMTRLLGDAGARVAAPQHEGVESKPIDMETALSSLAASELWLFPGQARNAGDVRMLAPKADFRGPIWNQTPDFYESGAARPDLVLKELQGIVSGAPADSLRYFFRIQ